MPPLAAERLRWILAILAFLALIGWGAVRRTEILTAVEGGQVTGASPQLGGDAAGYYRVAIERPFPCWSPVREPVLPVIGRLTLAVFGDLDAGTWETAQDEAARSRVLRNHAVLRRLSMALSLLALVALIGLTFVAFGRAAALVAGFFHADSTWLSWYGIAFLREDLVAILVCVLAAAGLVLQRLDSSRTRERRIAIAGAALAGAVLGLTRLEALGTVTLLALAWVALRLAARRFSRTEAAAAAVVIAAAWLAAAPLLAANRAATGRALHPLHVHAKFWRNHEFAGKPGYPTRAEVVRDSYCGPEISPGGYVFGLHSPPEVAGRYLSGLWAAWTRYLPRLCVDWPFVGWILPLGVAAAAWSRRCEGAWLAACMVVVILPFAFILTIDTVLTAVPPEGRVGVEPRFALPILPFAHLFAAAPVGVALRALTARGAAPPRSSPGT